MKSEIEQEAAMETIDDLIEEFWEKFQAGAADDQLNPILKEIFVLFREYCPFDDIVRHMNEMEEKIDEENRKRLN